LKDRQREAIQDAHISGWDILGLEIADSKYSVQILGDWRQNPFDIQTTNCEICVELARNTFRRPFPIGIAASIDFVIFHSQPITQSSIGECQIAKLYGHSANNL
jgi:hypothetical protein